MDFGLSEEQEILQRTAREFLARECPTALVREVAQDSDGVPRRLYEQMAELGWPGLIVPRAHGGQGMSFLDMALLLEEMGRAVLPGPFLFSSLVVPVALRRASAALQKRWLPEIARGAAIGTIAFSEESDRWDAGGIQARARRERDHYVLDGLKLFVPYAAAADFLLAAFRTSLPAEGGITVFLVPRTAPGVRIRPLQCVDLTRRIYEAEFRGVRVPDSAVVGRRGEGWSVIQAAGEAGALGIAADSLGGAERALEMAVEYSKVRIQFGRPIGSFQAIQHLAAEMVADIEPARALVWYAAYCLDTAPHRASEAISMAKARLSDVFSRVVDLAVQIHGGIGFTWEHDIHLWFKRALWNRAAFGDPAFHRERVAQLGRF